MTRRLRYALFLLLALIACAGVVYKIRTTVEIGSRESGMVASLLVDYNSFVHAGDIVAPLDPSLYDAQYQAAQAALAEANAALMQAMTAEVTVSESQRDHVVRVPNRALSFRPPPDVLKAIGETEPVIAKEPGVREVWQYDGKRFVPIAVHAGMADGGWTELVSGNVRAGDALVTSASYAPVPGR